MTLAETFHAVLADRDPRIADSYKELSEAAKDAAMLEITGYFAGCVDRREAASLVEVRKIILEAR